MHINTPRFQLAHLGSVLSSVSSLSPFKPNTSALTLVPLAVRTTLVRLELNQLFQRVPILLGRINRRSSSRHYGGCVKFLSDLGLEFAVYVGRDRGCGNKCRLGTRGRMSSRGRIYRFETGLSKIVSQFESGRQQFNF